MRKKVKTSHLLEKSNFNIYAKHALECSGRLEKNTFGNPLDFKKFINELKPLEKTVQN